MVAIVSFTFVHPETVLWVKDRMFVSDIGQFNERDGKVYVKTRGNWQVYASYLNDPKGLAYCEGVLYVADVDRVWAVKDKSAVFLLVGPRDFKAEFLNGLTCYMGKTLYVSDTYGNSVYKIDIKTREVKRVLSVDVSNDINGGDGIIYDPETRSIIASGYESGKVIHLTPDGKYTVIASGLKTPAGIGFDGKTVYIPLLEDGKVINRRIK